MIAGLLTFGRWPSSHDLDLVVESAPQLSHPFSYDAETPVSPDDLPELGALKNRLLHLASQVTVPLDVFLDYQEEDFNPALWIEAGQPWMLSWRYCGTDFFGGAIPLAERDIAIRWSA